MKKLWFLAVSLLVLFFLSRMWLPPGAVLAGHDSGLPLDARMFLGTRLFAWDSRLSFGSDNSHLFGSLGLHLVDYLSSLVAGVPSAGNWFNLFFWLSAIFTAGYILGSQLKSILGKYVPWFLPVIVVFNFFIFQSIFILERAKYSTLVALLLFSAVLVRFFKEEMGALRAAAWSSLIFLVFNSGGLIGLPLYGSLIVLVGTVLFFAPSGRTLGFILLTILLTLIVNAYQIVPFLPGLTSKVYLQHLTSRAIANNLDWLNYISQSTSFLNIFRLQGMPAWYKSAYVADPNHAYAITYLKNPLLIFVSFLFPVAAFTSFFWVKTGLQKKIVSFFALTLLISMFFMAGSHPPLGSLFQVFYNRIPGFSIFRTPYYKFASSYYVSFGVLASFTISSLVEKLANKKTGRAGILAVGALLAWLVYHQVLFKPENIFSWNKEASTHITIPDYVWQAKSWLSQNLSGEDRILLVPPLDAENYSDEYAWGYWSLSPLPYVLLSNNAVANELNLTPAELAWVDFLYQAVEIGNKDVFNQVTTKLGIKYILHRKDINDTDPYPDDTFSKLGLAPRASFDAWEIYQVGEQNLPKTKVSSFITELPHLELANLQSFLSDRWDSEFLLTTDKPKGLSLGGLNLATIKTTPCQSCFLENRQPKTRLPAVTIFSNSPFYFVKESAERKQLAKAQDEVAKVNLYLEFSQRRVSESRSMMSLEVSEEDIAANLKKTISYLKEIKNILKQRPDLLGSYLIARDVLDGVNPIAGDFGNYIREREFMFLSNQVRDSIYAVLWEIDEIENLYAQLTQNPESLRNQKIYHLNLGQEEQLYLDPVEFASDGQGAALLPKEMLLQFNGQKETAHLEEGTNGLLSIVTQNPIPLNNNLVLTMNFEMPDLYFDQGQKTVNFPTGQGTCLVGKIKDFKTERSYEINIGSTNKIQAVRLLIKAQNQKENPDYGFLQGMDEKLFNPTGTKKPYRYIYNPNSNYQNPTIYVCSGDADAPEIEFVRVYEFVSPEIHSVSQALVGAADLPNVNYEKVNSTKYQITFDAVSAPFLLVFNQRYSPFWKLSGIKDEDHFVINGYANAWVVRAPGKQELTLEYWPQRLFYYGLGISAATLVVVSLTLVFRREKR